MAKEVVVMVVVGESRYTLVLSSGLLGLRNDPHCNPEREDVSLWKLTFTCCQQSHWCGSGKASRGR